MTILTIRKLTLEDKTEWLPLWQNYLKFYRATIKDEITNNRFEELCRGEDLIGFVAVDQDNRLVGLIHAVFHPSTWTDKSYCYINDLYLTPATRGMKVAEQLFAAVYQEADRREAGRVYWLTQEYNGAARSLYDTFAKRSSFVVYFRQ